MTLALEYNINCATDMATTGDGVSDKPGCLMCNAQDGALYAVPVFTDDIDACRGEDVAIEEEEYSIDVCGSCLLFFASKRLLAFQLSGAARHSISFLKQRCGIESANLDATHSSSPPSSWKEGRTETETKTTDGYDEQREDFCPKGEGHVCPSGGGIDYACGSNDMDSEEMRETLEELEAILTFRERKVTKSRSVNLNKHISNKTSPTPECCPKKESADLTTPRSQQPRNARSISSSFGLRRKSKFSIDLTGVVFEDGIPSHWDLAKPACDHRPSSSPGMKITHIGPGGSFLTCDESLPASQASTQRQLSGLAASQASTQQQHSWSKRDSKSMSESISSESRRRGRDATRARLWSPEPDLHSSSTTKVKMNPIRNFFRGIKNKWTSSR